MNTYACQTSLLITNLLIMFSDVARKNNQKVYKRYLNVKSLVRNKRSHTLQQK